MEHNNDMNVMNEMTKIHSEAPTILAKWGKQLNAIDSVLGEDSSYLKRVSTAFMLENTSRYLDRMSALSQVGPMVEATQPSDVGYFRKYAINLLAAAIPNLIAQDIVSLQPIELSVA